MVLPEQTLVVSTFAGDSLDPQPFTGVVVDGNLFIVLFPTSSFQPIEHCLFFGLPTPDFSSDLMRGQAGEPCSSNEPPLVIVSDDPDVVIIDAGPAPTDPFTVYVEHTVFEEGIVASSNSVFGNPPGGTDLLGVFPSAPPGAPLELPEGTILFFDDDSGRFLPVGP